MTKTTEIALADQIDDVVAHCQPQMLQGMPRMAKTLRIAKGMQQLRQLMAGEIMADVMSLQGSQLGFLTDKKYSEAEIRDAVIAALIQGAELVGNEFNVIAAKCYLTKAYYKRQLREVEGMTYPVIKAGVPEMTSQGALVPMRATWTLGGEKYRLSCIKSEEADERIAVPVNKGMGVDAVLGKAEKRLLARILAAVTGGDFDESEEAELPVVDDPAEETDLEGEIAQALVGCDSLTAINAVEDHYAPQLGEHQQGMLAGLCEGRREAIRHTRGGRVHDSDND